MKVTWQLLLPGIPITSTRGALGWCSVTLVRMEGKIILVDTGSYGDRKLLLTRLREVQIHPDEVDDVFLTHFHFDHVLNFDLFKNAVFHLSEKEIHYVTSGKCQEVGDPYVPVVIYRLLEPQIKPFSGEVAILPGLRSLPLPGHTPGMTGLLLEKDRVLIAGDGIKNAREFLNRQAPPTFAGDEDALRSYCRAAEEALIIVPGHDNPFRLPIHGEVEYLNHFELKLTFSKNPSAEPQIIQLLPDSPGDPQAGSSRG